MTTIRMAIYARVSSEKQAEKRTIESQIGALKEYASQHEYKIDEDLIFLDDGVSGATLVRPALDRLRDKALNNQIDKVLVLSPDRLARKSAHQIILVEEFSRFGVEIVFSNREVSSSPEDQLLLQIQGVISEYEREKIMERSRRGKLYKAKKGTVNVLSGAPYGYVYIKKTDSADARFEIYFEEAKIVRQVFDLYTKENLSIGAISKHLNTEEVPTRKRIGIWERSTVWGMLRNSAYMGEAGFRKTIRVERDKTTKLARDNGLYPKKPKSSSRDRPKEERIVIKVPAIISKEVFDKAAIRLEENKRLSPRNNKKYHYLLSGLMHCKECGYSIYGSPASHTKYKRLYYRCMGQDGFRWPKGRTCTSHPVRVEVLDELVWEQTKKLIEKPEIVLQEYSDRCNKKKTEKLSSERLTQKKKLEISNLNMEKERLLDLYQNGVISLNEIEKRLSNIRGKIAKVEGEIELLQQENEKKHRQMQLIEQFDVFKEKLSCNLTALSFEDKKRIIRLLVTEVIVDVNKEEILVKHVMPVSKSCGLRSGSNNSTLRSSFIPRHKFTISLLHRRF